MSHTNLYDLMEKLTPERKARVIRRIEDLIRNEQQAQDLYERIKSGKVKIALSPTDQIEPITTEYLSLVQEFIREVLRLNMNEVLITDDSSLYDFAPLAREPDEDNTMYFARRNAKVGAMKFAIRTKYNIPPGTEIPTRLLPIFKLILAQDHKTQ